MQKFIDKLSSKKMSAVLAVQSTLLNSISNYLHQENFLQIMPVMLSPITDPLCHSVFDAQIDYCGQKLKLTKSMILHKQIALSSAHISKIFAISPNIRLEKPHCAKTKRHLIEFSQIDMEIKGATKYEFMSLCEKMIVRAFEDVKKYNREELELLGRELTIPTTPFCKYESKECKQKIGEDFETKLSCEQKSLFWIMNHEREFYDMEDDKISGYYHNYDLVYPQGYGEALSGGQRDYKYEILSKKIQKRAQSEESFGIYTQLAKNKYLVPSAGGGLGVERLVRYACGLDEIEQVSPFAKIPSENFLI